MALEWLPGPAGEPEKEWRAWGCMGRLEMETPQPFQKELPVILWTLMSHFPRAMNGRAQP